MKRRTPLFVLLTLAAALLIGCGGGALSSNGHHTTGSTGSGSNTGGNSTTGSTSGVINKDKGGIVSSANGKAVVVIPPKALLQNTAVKIEPVTFALPAAPQNEQMLPGTAFECTPDGLFFAIPSSLTIGYDPINLPIGAPETSVQIFTVVNGAWQPVPGSTVDTASHAISVPVGHFSIYAVMGPVTFGAGPVYDVIDLGLLPGDTRSRPTGISSDGKVAGISDGSGISHAFLWSNGLLSDLLKRPGDLGAEAYCVNLSGVAGGYSIQTTTAGYPVLFNHGQVTQVNTQFGAGTGKVTAINDANDYIVENALVRGGTLTPLTGFTASNASGALNAKGVVAGSAGSHAALYRNGSVTDAGLLEGYDVTVGVSLSDDDKLVGTATKTSDSKSVGFLYANGMMTKIAPLTGDNIMNPSSVNLNGQVVGTSSKDFVTSRGVIYSNGVLTDLNTLVPATNLWYIAQAVAINNRGQIAAVGYNNNVNHALLLNPRPGRARR